MLLFIIKNYCSHKALYILFLKEGSPTKVTPNLDPFSSPLFSFRTRNQKPQNQTRTKQKTETRNSRFAQREAWLARRVSPSMSDFSGHLNRAMSRPDLSIRTLEWCDQPERREGRKLFRTRPARPNNEHSTERKGLLVAEVISVRLPRLAADYTRVDVLQYKYNKFALFFI